MERCPVTKRPSSERQRHNTSSEDPEDSVSDESTFEGLGPMPRSESAFREECGGSIQNTSHREKSFHNNGGPEKACRNGQDQSPNSQKGESSRLPRRSHGDGMFLVKSSAELSRTLEYLVRMIVELQDDVKLLSKKINKICGGNQEDITHNPDLDDILQFFPLKSHEDFENCERKLNSPTLRQMMMVHLSQYSHSTIQGSIKFILKKTLDPDFARTLNWAGRGLKRGIRNTYFQEVVGGAVRKNPILKDAPIDKIEKEIKKWLVFSFRLASSFRKAERKDVPRNE